MEKNRYQEVDERFSKFMFGERRSRKEDKSPAEDDVEIEELLKPKSNKSKAEEIPYWELMENIDRLMTSLSNFKPLVKKVTPFIEKFLTKKE